MWVPIILVLVAIIALGLAGVSAGVKRTFSKDTDIVQKLLGIVLMAIGSIAVYYVGTEIANIAEKKWQVCNDPRI